LLALWMPWLVPTAVARAQGFEGAITMRLNSGGRGAVRADTVEFLSRGGNVRASLNSPAGRVSILGLAAEEKTFVVIESQRAYIEVSAEAAGQAAAAVASNVTRTGRREQIAGYECEHVLVVAAGAATTQATDVCLSSALGRWVNPLASLGGGRLSPWQRELLKDGGFPLKVVTADGTVALEVLRVEKRRVSDAQFRIPADFTKMDMPRRP